MLGKKEVQEAAVKKPFYKKWWFWVLAVFVCLAALSPKNGTSRKGGETGTAAPEVQEGTAAPEVQEGTAAPEVQEGTAAPESSAAPEVLPEPAGAESEPEPAGESAAAGPESYSVPLGSASVEIRPHPVMNGSRTEILFNIGTGETSAVLSDLSAEDLAAFVAGLDFDGYGYGSIVLSFRDGTGLIFQKGSANFTADYGVVDVGPGNFEMVERQGAIWNDTGEGWYYMTVEEMAAADAAADSAAG